MAALKIFRADGARHSGGKAKHENAGAI